MKALLFFLRPHKGLMGLLTLLTIFNAISETLNMALLYPILTLSLNMVPETNGNLFFSITNRLAEFVPVDNTLIANSILFIAFAIIIFIGRVMYIHLSTSFTAKLVNNTEMQVFESYAKADYQFFIDNKQGDLLYKASVAPQFLAQVVQGIITFIAEIALAITVLFLLISLSWQGTIAVIIGGLLYSFFIRYLSRNISYPAGQGMRLASQKQTVALNEYITGIKQIKAHNATVQWRNRSEERRVGKECRSRWSAYR